MSLPSAGTLRNYCQPIYNLPQSSLSYPIETMNPIRNSSETWARSCEDKAETFVQHLQCISKIIIEFLSCAEDFIGKLFDGITKLG